MAQEEKIKEAKRLYKTANADQKYVLESLFPELKESEGEKTKRILHSIANKISQHLRDIFTEEEFQCYDAWSNAWLEKQGEQKPVIEIKTPEESLGVDSDTYNKIVDECVYSEQKSAWSVEDEVGLGDAMWAIKQAKTIAKDENDMGNLWYAERWLKSLKDRVQPKQEWSEEDKKRMNHIIQFLKDKDRWKDSERAFPIEEDIRWLKSLRPQNTWKPSDEQLKMLDKTIGVLDRMQLFGGRNALIDLKHDLKKLRDGDV